MFTRQAEPNRLPAPEPSLGVVHGQTRRAAPARAPTLIAHGLSITGEIVGDGEVHIDGALQGEVRVQRLVVGETAHVEGAVLAESVEVRGRVTGTITARQIRLYPTARVSGDLTCDQVAVELGAVFEGRCTRPVEAAASQPTVETTEVVEQAQAPRRGGVVRLSETQAAA